MAARRTQRVLRSLAWALLISILVPVATEAQETSLAELVDGRDYAALRARGPQVMDELAALYRQRTDPSDRERVAWAFYQLGIKSPAAAEALLPDVKDRELPERVRISAQYALGRVSDRGLVIHTLLENMRHGGSFLIRDKAACALAYDQIHLNEVQKAELFHGLISALDDEKADVRRIAIKALKIHTGQTKGYRPNASRRERLAAMETWWRWLQEYSEQL